MDILNEVPQVPRPFKTFDQDRKLKLMQLASTLLEVTPNESTRRTVEYLVKICSDLPPSMPPRLIWIEERALNEFDELERLDACHSVQRLLPQMRFVARLQRPWVRGKMPEELGVACMKHHQLSVMINWNKWITSKNQCFDFAVYSQRSNTLRAVWTERLSYQCEAVR